MADTQGLKMKFRTTEKTKGETLPGKEVGQSEGIFSKQFVENIKKEHEKDPENSTLSYMMHLSEIANYGVIYGRKEPTSNSQGRGDLRSVLSNTLPTDKLDQIAAAYEWYSSDDLLSSLIDTKVDFTVAGMRLRCHENEAAIFERFLTDTVQAPNETDAQNESKIQSLLRDYSQEQLDRILELLQFQQYLTAVEQKWDFYSILKNLMADFYIADNMILYWKADEQTQGLAGDNDILPELDRYSLLPGVQSIVALSPEDANYEDSLGVDILQVRPPEALVERVEQAKNKTTAPERNAAIEELQKDGIPLKWIEAIIAGDEFVALSRDEGDQWLVVTSGRANQGLSRPSMFPLFLWLEFRDMLRHGDFSAAYMAKHFIFQAKTGESIQQGAMAGMKNNWATPKDIELLYNIIASVSQALRLATNHTVTFDFIFPPEEMFSAKRYEKCELAIHIWSKVPKAIVNGESTYSSGHLSIKPLTGDVTSTRRRISSMITNFFDHTTVRNAMQSSGNPIPENCSVTAVFDENFLTEPSQLLDELKFLHGSGAGDPNMSLRELGRDPEVYRLAKLRSIVEQRILEMHQPITDIVEDNNVKDSSGQADNSVINDGPGRPATSENPDSRPRSGSPASAVPSQ